MYFLYVDESGKSGLTDPAQPFFVLGGLAVHESTWLAMESDLNSRVDVLVPRPRPDNWELHMTDMVYGKGHFKHLSRNVRAQLSDAVLDVIDRHEPTLIFCVVDKARHVAKYGDSATPCEDYTYMLMIERFNHFLGRRGEVGMIVSDDQKGAEDVVRRAHSRYRRHGTGYTKIEHVIETPFFVPSHWSRMLQIVDVATWYVNRGLRAKQTGRVVPPELARLERRLHGYPRHEGRGFKLVP